MTVGAGPHTVNNVIFNLAGQVSHIDSMQDPYTDLEINCCSQLSILEACGRNNPGVKVVFAGTRQVYGWPDSLPVTERHLVKVAGRHGLTVIEDCCQAHLATCAGTPVGTRSLGGAFSFYPTKNLGALGDGGAVVTNDVLIADRVRILRNGGQVDRYQHVEAGINSRLDEIQAAVLRVRVPRL